MWEIPLIKLKEEKGLIFSLMRICLLLSLALFLPRFFGVCKKNGIKDEQSSMRVCE